MSKSWPENAVEGAETRLGCEGGDDKAVEAGAGEETAGENVLFDGRDVGAGEDSQSAVVGGGGRVGQEPMVWSLSLQYAQMCSTPSWC